MLLVIILILALNRNNRSPTSDNLVPIRLDIEINGQRFKDAFTWNPNGNNLTCQLCKLFSLFIPCHCRFNISFLVSFYYTIYFNPVWFVLCKRLLPYTWWTDFSKPPKTAFIVIDPDSEVVVFAKRTVKDLKLPPAFVTQIAQSIQVKWSLVTILV